MGCREEFPRLLALRQRYSDRGLEVVLVTREPAERIRSIPDLAGAPITILTDADATFEEFQVTTIPRTVLFDASGRVAEDTVGYSESLMERLEQRLRQSPATGLSSRTGTVPQEARGG